jgi:hypothetical protein
LVEKRWCTSPAPKRSQRIAQVVVEAADLVRQQQALVDDGAAREARHVELGRGPAGRASRPAPERVLGLLADDEELALEGILVGAVLAAADEAWRITGIDSITALPSPSSVTGTSRQPIRLWPSLATNFSNWRSMNSRAASSCGRKHMATA